MIYGRCYVRTNYTEHAERTVSEMYSHRRCESERLWIVCWQCINVSSTIRPVVHETFVIKKRNRFCVCSDIPAAWVRTERCNKGNRVQATGSAHACFTNVSRYFETCDQPLPKKPPFVLPQFNENFVVTLTCSVGTELLFAHHTRRWSV
jgi:hypothetical protein